MALPEKPFSRKEQYLSKIAGQDTEIPEEPFSREEMYLDEIAKNGGGGGYTLPIASADELGGVKVGSNLSIDENGVLSAGGGGPTVVQTTGTSTTDVMSQNATTSTVYADPAQKTKVWISNDNRSSEAGASSVCIGDASYNSSNYGISIGGQSWSGRGMYNVAIGYHAQNVNVNTNSQSVMLLGSNITIPAGGQNISGCVALGAYSGNNVTTPGVVDISSSSTAAGCNNTNYRRIAGVHDAEDYHDAATLGQLVFGHVLSEDDYDFTDADPEEDPDAEPDGIAIWMLDDGEYSYASEDGTTLKMYFNTDATTYGTPQYLNMQMFRVKVSHYIDGYERYFAVWEITCVHDQGNITKLDGSFCTIQGITKVDDGTCFSINKLGQEDLLES